MNRAKNRNRIVVTLAPALLMCLAGCNGCWSFDPVAACRETKCPSADGGDSGIPPHWLAADGGYCLPRCSEAVMQIPTGYVGPLPWDAGAWRCVYESQPCESGWVCNSEETACVPRPPDAGVVDPDAGTADGQESDAAPEDGGDASAPDAAVPDAGSAPCIASGRGICTRGNPNQCYTPCQEECGWPCLTEVNGGVLCWAAPEDFGEQSPDPCFTDQDQDGVPRHEGDLYDCSQELIWDRGTPLPSPCAALNYQPQ